ncbi:hypothetical protein [Acetobacter sicerae]|uniref:hypothetical protein n=1 Tax=Acetobacter sicerae TaxID=85325 RepID=UPI00156AAFDB|nr:hypothetical protein [Acetobacter sicerae]NHN91239.1 hypothetical protein [Acetobacter sicerae]
MDFAKVLTGGVAAWLEFERACDRTGLFSEKYLTSAVGQILAARTGNRVKAEFTHPLLASIKKGAGRRPQVDFIVHDESGKIVLAVETKWAGRTTPSTKEILWDLVRLELIAHHENARCIFLLAGTGAKLKEIFDHSAFSDARTRPHRRPLLRHDSNVIHTTPLVPLVPVRFKMLRELFEPYQDFRFAERVTTRRTAPRPEVVKPKEYQVIAWEVLPKGNRIEFQPGRSKFFA